MEWLLNRFDLTVVLSNEGHLTVVLSNGFFVDKV